MLKKILLNILLFSLYFANISSFVYAVTPSPISSTPKALETKTPTQQSKIDKDVKILKEKIATKVAELQKENVKAFAGTITKKDKDSFDLKTEKGDNFKVSFEEDVTKIFQLAATGKKSIEYADLKKGDFVVVTGHLIENNLTAGIIYKDEEFIVGSGKITDVNKSDFSIKLMTTDKTEYVLDIESSTKQQFLDVASLKISTYGFSKLKPGDVVHFSAKKGVDPKSSRLTLQRILTIPQESFIKK